MTGFARLSVAPAHLNLTPLQQQLSVDPPVGGKPLICPYGEGGGRSNLSWHHGMKQHIAWSTNQPDQLQVNKSGVYWRRGSAAETSGDTD